MYTLTTVHPSTDCWRLKDWTCLMLHVFPPTNHDACLAINDDASPAICNQYVHASCCVFYRPKCKANLLSSKLHSFRVWCNPSVILFNQKSVFRQFGSTCKQANLFQKRFERVCCNAAKQVARFCRPLYRSFSYYGGVCFFGGTVLALFWKSPFSC